LKKITINGGRTEVPTEVPNISAQSGFGVAGKMLLDAGSSSAERNSKALIIPDGCIEMILFLETRLGKMVGNFLFQKHRMPMKAGISRYSLILKGIRLGFIPRINRLAPGIGRSKCLVNSLSEREIDSLAPKQK